MSSIADKAFLALKPQSNATTPVIPDNHFGLVSESIRVNPNFTADRRMKGLDWKSDDLLAGPKMIEGEIVCLGDPESLGHLLNMTYAKGSTTGDATDGYTHPFTPGDGDSYSIEIPRGDYAQRIWGARADSLKFEYVDNKLQVTAAIKALGQFYTASVGVALSGASTSLEFSVDSGVRPADGLVVGDVIIIIQDNGTAVERTLTSVNSNGRAVGFASTSITAAVGQPVFLKKQTASLGDFVEPFYMGNTLVGVDETSADADTAAATRATATPVYQLTSTLKNNLFDAPATGFPGPSALLNQVKEADLEVRRLFETPVEYQKWIEKVKEAITVIATGRFIKTDHTTSELLTIKYHKVKSITTEEPLEVGSMIFDTQKYEALYDADDGAAIEIELVNRTAGTEY